MDDGYLYENAIAQTIASCGKTAYYHTWQKNDSTHLFEIDFLISEKDKIDPIEVKSSSVKRHLSLDAFSEKYSSVTGNRYIFSQKDTGKDGAILLKPMYMALPLIEKI